jgi:hypothetical protein
LCSSLGDLYGTRGDKKTINVAFHNLCINQALIAGTYNFQSRVKISDNKNKPKINKRNIKY